METPIDYEPPILVEAGEFTELTLGWGYIFEDYFEPGASQG